MRIVTRTVRVTLDGIYVHILRNGVWSAVCLPADIYRDARDKAADRQPPAEETAQEGMNQKTDVIGTSISQ